MGKLSRFLNKVFNQTVEQMGDGPRPMMTGSKSTADLLRDLLPKLNVSFETEQDENRLNFSFSYQGANFLVHTWDGWQFIEVNYCPSSMLRL